MSGVKALATAYLKQTKSDFSSVKELAAKLAAALAALRDISWRPQLARPHLYASQSVIDWLRGPGSQALADLAAHLDRQIVLGVSSQGLVIRDGPADVPG